MNKFMFFCNNERLLFKRSCQEVTMKTQREFVLTAESLLNISWKFILGSSDVSFIFKIINRISYRWLFALSSSFFSSHFSLFAPRFLAMSTMNSSGQNCASSASRPVRFPIFRIKKLYYNFKKNIILINKEHSLFKLLWETTFWPLFSPTSTFSISFTTKSF